MIKRKKLDKWSELETKRLELARQVKAIEAEVEQLEAEFEKELKASGKTSIIRSGYTLAYVDGRVNVKWKDEFVRACGSEAAQKLVEAAAKVAEPKFTISRPKQDVEE